ncbi:MAG: arginine repressor [Clostridia bacterium]|nr:arginine repressor [Clostridia bacterium]
MVYQGSSKVIRHQTILEIIQKEVIETQEELADALKKREIRVTQATVSRDIKELQLTKMIDAQGNYRYVPPGTAGTSLSKRLIHFLVETVISVECAENLVVIKTISGSANVVAEAIDNLEWKEIVGTIAGDNTLFVATRKPQDAQNVAERFRQIAHVDHHEDDAGQEQ